jgi:SnoaL-like domain
VSGDLDARIARLEDLEAARAVVHRYVSVVDTSEFGALNTVFTVDAELVIPSRTIVGLTAIEEFYRGAAARDAELKKHFVTNVNPRWLSSGEVEVDSYFQFTGTGAGASSIGWGTYRDRARVRDGIALLTGKRIELTMRTNLVRGWPGAGSTERTDS